MKTKISTLSVMALALVFSLFTSCGSSHEEKNAETMPSMDSTSVNHEHMHSHGDSTHSHGHAHDGDTTMHAH